jgi:hypothetical protein
LGNQKGQGVQAGCRNFWDADTDGVAFEQYIDDNLFCLVTVWAVYAYHNQMHPNFTAYFFYPKGKDLS